MLLASFSALQGRCAFLEGVALLERLAYEVVSDLGAPVAGPIRTVGGAARSALWLRIRASVCNRPFIVPVVADAAMGVAIVAATGRLHPSLSSATQAMVRSGNEVTPDPGWVPVYEERYVRFKDELRARLSVKESLSPSSQSRFSKSLRKRVRGLECLNMNRKYLLKVVCQLTSQCINSLYFAQ